jgi:hypothetical protein
MKMPTENIALLFIYENYDRKFFCVIFNGNCSGIKTNKNSFDNFVKLLTEFSLVSLKEIKT